MFTITTFTITKEFNCWLVLWIFFSDDEIEAIKIKNGLNSGFDLETMKDTVFSPGKGARKKVPSKRYRDEEDDGNDSEASQSLLLPRKKNVS